MTIGCSDATDFVRSPSVSAPYAPYAPYAVVLQSFGGYETLSNNDRW
jgi:hypothetical protein